MLGEVPFPICATVSRAFDIVNKKQYKLKVFESRLFDLCLFHAELLYFPIRRETDAIRIAADGFAIGRVPYLHRRPSRAHRVRRVARASGSDKHKPKKPLVEPKERDRNHPPPKLRGDSAAGNNSEFAQM